MKPLSLWKIWATWPFIFTSMLVYLSYLFMLWTINKARKCFSGLTNTAELSWCSSHPCVHTRRVFEGHWAQCSSAHAHSWRADLLAFVFSAMHEGWKQSHWWMCTCKERPSNNLQTPRESPYARKERGITRGEFDLTRGEVGKRE